MEKTITENGTYDAVKDDVDGYSIVHVSVSEPVGTINIVKNGIYDVKNDASANVNVAPLLDEKSVIPTKEVREITPDNDFDGLSRVIVQPIPDEYIIPEGTRNINQNGDYDVREKATVVVNVPEKVLGSKTITENGVYDPINDGLDGYNFVNVTTSGVDINDYYYTNNNYSGDIRAYIKEPPMLNTENLTTMYQFFSNCQNLTNIPDINTSNVTNMSMMFSECKKIKTIPLLNTGKVKNMVNMFGYCVNLEEVPLMNTGNVTDMRDMFTGCRKLVTIPLIDTSKVTNMRQMFAGCYGLTTIPSINTGSVVDICSMFQKCYSLKTIPLLDTSNVKYMATTFNQSGIETIPSINTENVIAMNTAFSTCNYLTSLPKLNLKSVTNISDMFQGTTNITELGGFENLGQAYLTTSPANYFNYTLNLSPSPNITHDSLMNVINNLYDIKAKGCKEQRLQLGSANLAKLTDEEKQIAIDKGWNVS